MNAPAKQYHEFVTPLARMVGGNLYTPKTTDSENRPLVFKSGPNAGQPRVDFYGAYAIPKTPGVTHWAQEKGWGETLWAAGHALGGNSAQRGDFAWKVTDGDSQIPNTKGKKPCDNEGFPGHWILHTGNSTAPKIVNSDGSGFLLEVDAVKPGYFVQVSVSVNGNGSTQNPGIFLNQRVVSLQFHGQPINFGVDPASLGFGGHAAPAGAVTIPVGAVGHAAPPPPAAGGNPPPPPPAPAAAGSPPPPPPAPGASMAPPPPAAAPAPAPAPVAGFAANAGTFVINGQNYVWGKAYTPGLTYDSYLASQWTHDMMVRGDIIVAVAGAAPAAPAPAPAAPPPPPPAAAPAPVPVAYRVAPHLPGHTLDSLRAASPGESDAQIAAKGWFVV